MPDRSAALGLVALAGLAWGLPVFCSRGREALAPAPGAIYARGSGEPLQWSPGRTSEVGADPRDGRFMDPEARSWVPVGGWPGLLLGNPLDVNLASQEDLEALPGIGPALARAILVDREVRGSFATVDALARVKGLGPKTVAKLRPYLCVDP